MPLNRVAVYRRRPAQRAFTWVLLATVAIAPASARRRASSTRGRSSSTDWQRAITHEHPELLVRGLIHSDGCRFLNRVRHGEKVYVYPRYMFSNRSRQIHGIFTEHLDLLGIEWRWSNDHTISVARRDSVARLDAFVGPKR